LNAIFNLLSGPFLHSETENSLFWDQPDLFKFILSHLDYSSLHHSVLVSKYWKKITIDTTRQDQFFRISQLAGVLRKSIQDPYAGEFFNIQNDRSILACDHLPKIKASTLDYLDLFIDSLKKLQALDLDRLETLSSMCLKPRFFEKLFELSKIYQKKERDYAEKDPKYKYHYLAVELLEQGHTERSFKVGASTMDPSYNFLVLANKLAASGQMLKALEAVEGITNKETQAFALKQVLAYCFHPKNLFNVEAWKIVRLYG
jgi:hypothetical protein